MHPLIYDWNRSEADQPSLVMLDDETLRDGLQSPSVRCPSIDEKIRILHLIDRLGIDTADIGLPGAGPHVVQDVERLAREIVTGRLNVKANCAARTVTPTSVPSPTSRSGWGSRSSAARSSAPARSGNMPKAGRSISWSR
jgi:hypothetical protein